ncbi:MULTISPECIES: hypothetical protein [Chloroflexus]|jgi:hypothetical protein|uniref:Colicin V production protein n=1 Tax=Chloroflexus aurantiacus (strain ATCC 29366 / DSM 635 / J-10-fl) TaxID=324602 RepID=A9WG71_CHLAA|nr:hypothetical protein [Chloroflexus aurantiacus]ABY33992.1 conserved hypothetical protein [Chloroflexus aurantiacus J-10-fl]RMG51596.1 MAG: hypothetical protein D6716_05575 [Chloroflexota bacterium]HBW68358.1 hypothetical protein [Chloroflexus aurantiacus]
MIEQWMIIPLAQPVITLNLNGVAILLILMALGGYAGYQQGMRNLLTLALWTIIAYITCVQGGDFIVGLINRIWVNAPRFAAFLIGNDPSLVPPLDPLITPGFQVPLFFRLMAFIALILLGMFFDSKAAWKGPPKERLARPLGLFVGALIALLWTNAAVVFWREFVNNGGILEGPIATLLNVLPDVSILLPSLIAIFFMILGLIILFNFPKVWKP